MLVAIESFVRLFEELLVRSEVPPPKSAWHADNDNGEIPEEERRWAAYR